MLSEPMFCHDPECGMFNEQQTFKYAPSDWDGPAEWIEEPECRGCHAQCEEQPLYLDEMGQELGDHLESRVGQFDDLDHEAAKILVQYVNTRRRVYINAEIERKVA